VPPFVDLTVIMAAPPFWHYYGQTGETTMAEITRRCDGEHAFGKRTPDRTGKDLVGGMRRAASRAW
jgi:hypothetical protein